MATFTADEVYQTMSNTGIVGVFFHPEAQTIKAIVKACYDNGTRLFEYTNRGESARQVFSELIAYAASDLPGMIIGAGTIMDKNDADTFIASGANFIVSPILDAEVGKTCIANKIPWLPGCGSVTEIYAAQKLGAEVVKLFPAAAINGPEFIKAVKGPMPKTKIMPSGGVTSDEENLRQWFNAGAYCVGLGTKAFVQTTDGSYDLQQTGQNFGNAVQAVSKIKSALK